MFNIVFYQNQSENITVNKTLLTVVTLSGVLRNGTSIVDPVIMINGSLSDVSSVPGFAKINYAYIQEFGRYYYVRNIESVNNSCVAVSMHVDVLMSFKDEIKANKGIVSRAENASQFNLYLNDGSLKAYQNPYILTEPFPAGFTGSAFCLAVAGG